MWMLPAILEAKLKGGRGLPKQELKWWCVFEREGVPRGLVALGRAVARRWVRGCVWDRGAVDDGCITWKPGATESIGVAEHGVETHTDGGV